MGIGAIIYRNGEITTTHSDNVPASAMNSNNVAEYKAFIWILDTLLLILQEQPGAQVEISGDSKLVIMQMNGIWRIRKGLYAGFALEAKAKVAKLKERAEIALKWIPGHTNHEADALSRQDVKGNAFAARSEAKERKYKDALLREKKRQAKEWAQRELDEGRL